LTLCIDIGNSAIKCALVNVDEVERRSALVSTGLESAAAVNDSILAVLDGAVVENVTLCSVVPELTDLIASGAQSATGVRPWVLTHDAPYPFTLDSDTATQTGIDRLAAATGAVLHAGKDVIVVDFGSATTVDLVHAGRYRGGAIIAGPELSLRALSQHTAQLPRLDFDPAEAGRRIVTTADAMQFGALMSTVGGACRAAKHLEATADKEMGVVYTGGVGAGLGEHLPRRWCYSPDLLLLGLSYLTRLRSQ